MNGAGEQSAENAQRPPLCPHLVSTAPGFTCSACEAESQTETARVYLDVDGVFNAVANGVPDWGWETHQTVKVLGYPIRYSPDFVALVNEVAATPGIGIYWLTTWCHEAPTKLCAALGINGSDWPVVGYDHWRRATGLPWWKHLAIAEHLDGFDGPVLWIDDDHGVDAACQAWLAGQPQILTIAPSTGRGVTRLEGEIIRRFVSEFSSSPGRQVTPDA